MIGATAIGVVVAMAIYKLPPSPRTLGIAVRGAGDRAASSHPVTAVLLEFRAWDTFLEVGVLLLAVLGATALSGLPGTARAVAGGPVHVPLVWLVRLAVPGLILAAGHVLLVGSHAPGGAFHAGALLAAAAVLLEMGGRATIGGLSPALLRGCWSVGCVAFLLAGAVGPLGGRAFLELAASSAGAWILFIEACVAVAIAAALASLFLAARCAGGER